jgi:hypothetical protein
MINDALIEVINSAYRRLSAAAEDLVRADRELAEYVRRGRLDNAEAILEAKNERTASLYLDGLLDTDEHRRLESIRARAVLDLQHARREVDRNRADEVLVEADRWLRRHPFDVRVIEARDRLRAVHPVDHNDTEEADGT